MTDVEPKSDPGADLVLPRNPELLPAEDLLELLKQPGACLYAVGGDLHTRRASDITLIALPIHITDLMDDTKFKDYVGHAENAPRGTVSVKMASNWRYGFDSADPSFRISGKGQGFIVDPSGENVPARVVNVRYGADLEFHFLTLD